MSGTKKILIAVAVVVVLAAIVGSSFLGKKKTKGEEVYVAKAGRKSIVSSVTGTGRIEPKTKVNVQSSVIGEIVRLPVKEGDRVKKGDLLIQVEPDRYQSEVDRLDAAVRMTRIAIDQERVQLENVRRILRRSEGLNRDGFVAPELLERAQLDVRMSEINLQSLEEQVTQAAAALAKAKDELRKTTIVSPMNGIVTQLNAETGEITLTGTMNNPGTVIMVVSDMSEVLAEVDVDETRIVKVKPGQSARVVVNAVGELHPYSGTVTEIAGTAVQRQGQQVQVFPVKVALTSPDERLRPGMTAKARIESERSAGAITVPIQAVLLKAAADVDKELADRTKKGRAKTAGNDEPEADAKLATASDGSPSGSGDTAGAGEAGGASEATDAPAASEESAIAGDKDGKREVVYRIADGKAVLTLVKTGLSDETTVSILEGLSEGDEVITGPYRTVKQLKDGQAVKKKSGAPSDGKQGDAAKKDADKGDGEGAE